MPGDTKELFSSMFLGIVCPMANEEETVTSFVPEVLERCRDFQKVCFYAVLDTKSVDHTLQRLRDLQSAYPQISIVWAPENRCIVDAYVRGYREALKAGCHWILEIDAGFSHQPSDLPSFFEKLSEGYECIFGSRFCPGGSMENVRLSRRLVSRGGTWLTNFLLGTQLKDMTSGFELFSRSALDSVLRRGIRSRAHFFQTEIKFYCRHLRITEVPIHYSNPSQSVNGGILRDAFSNLFFLWKLKITGGA